MTNLLTGLTKKELQTNLTKYGRNSLPDIAPPSKLSLFIRQFTNPLIYILFVAALLTLFLGDIPEFIGITLVVLINGILGFIQENKAEATLATLSTTLRPFANVLREQHVVRIPSNEITVGEIVLLKIGDKIPADGVLFQGNDISVTEAILTGESVPVNKTQIGEKALARLLDSATEQDTNEYKDSLLYMGTSVMSGVGRMIVTDIGTDTKFGQIADSVLSQTNEDTPLQARLKRLSQIITLAVIIISTLMFLYGMAIGMEFKEILELTIAVAVASIPEGLVIALTVILALGMNRIFKRRAIVRKLLAAETLGSVDTICIDKTGTLTEGKMQVAHTYFTDPLTAKKALVANNHGVNTLEIALSEWEGGKIKASEMATIKEEKYLDYKIFDSRTKFSATLGEENLYIVGAPEKLLDASDLSREDKDKWYKELEAFSKKGYRLVAAAYKPSEEAELPTLELPKNLIWLGLVVILDPLRPNLMKVFEEATTAGISVKVITGDYGETAKYVIANIGIDLTESESISGAELNELSDKELATRIPSTKLFYRTTPDQKLRIVEALQNTGHIVAMMGDGINDTPALKRAQIGIVVNNATDFSKETADMVLLDSNFETIISAVEEGRNIFENMRKVIAYLLSDAFDELVITIGAILLGLPFPLLPLQILYINFIADGFPDLALTFEKPEHEVMNDKPKPKNYPLLDREVGAMIFAIGIVVSLFLLVIYYVFLNNGMELDLLRTLVFTLLGVDSLFYVFSVRSFRKPIWRQNIFGNRLLIYSVLLGVISMVAAVYFPPLQSILGTVPLPIWGWLLVIANTIINIALIELIKHFFLTKDK